jgi:hypothetical protein
MAAPKEGRCFFGGCPLGTAETPGRVGLNRSLLPKNRLVPREAESFLSRAQPAILSRCLREQSGAGARSNTHECLYIQSTEIRLLMLADVRS